MAPYEVINGETVDLLCPFPEQEATRVWGWSKNFKNIIETDETPHNRSEFTQRIQVGLPECLSFGVIDKGGALKRDVELPICGIVVFQPLTSFNGNLFVASARGAYSKRLMDEAVKLACKYTFRILPELGRITMLVHERNSPAGALARRAGFKREGVMRSAIRQHGITKDVIVFGLIQTQGE